MAMATVSCLLARLVGGALARLLKREKNPLATVGSMLKWHLVRLTFRASNSADSETRMIIRDA